MNLETIADYLETKGIGTKGSTIFIDFMPDETKRGVVLVSPLTGNKIDYELPNYRKTTFQVIIRDSNHKDGSDFAKQVSDLLTIVQETSDTLVGFNVKYIKPKHDPVVFPRLTGGGLEFSINFDACYVII